MNFARHVAVACFATSVALASCRSQEPPDEPVEAAFAADSLGDSVFVADRVRRTLPPDRIYYTLTDHAWYAQGEPLLHDGRQYEPAGRPEAASLEEMQPAGEYEGVRYYQRNGTADPVVYVPVFKGYWQAFHARPSD